VGISQVLPGLPAVLTTTFLTKNPRTAIFLGTNAGKFGLKRIDISNSTLPAKDPAALDFCLPVSHLCGFGGAHEVQ